MNWRAFVFVFLFPALVSAQKPAPLWTLPGDDKIVVLRKGAEAPFDGQLFSPETALRWSSWLEQYRERLELDVKYATDLAAAEQVYQQAILESERKNHETIRADLQLRLQRSEKARLLAEEAARNPAWYRTREFGLVLGVVSSVAVLGLSVWALEARQGD